MEREHRPEERHHHREKLPHRRRNRHIEPPRHQLPRERRAASQDAQGFDAPYWCVAVDKLIEDHGVPVLDDRGSHSREEMRRSVTDTYGKFDAAASKPTPSRLMATTSPSSNVRLYGSRDAGGEMRW